MALNEALEWSVLSLPLQNQSLCCVSTISQSRISLNKHTVYYYLVTCRNPNPDGDLTNRLKTYWESKVRTFV